jgi:hypothetical protein
MLAIMVTKDPARGPRPCLNLHRAPGGSVAMKRPKGRTGAKAGLAVHWAAGGIWAVATRWIRVGAATGKGEIPAKAPANWLAATRAVAFTTKSWRSESLPKPAGRNPSATPQADGRSRISPAAWASRESRGPGPCNRVPRSQPATIRTVVRRCSRAADQPGGMLAIDISPGPTWRLSRVLLITPPRWQALGAAASALPRETPEARRKVSLKP